MTVIYRQLIMNDISLFTSQPKAKFYDELFINLNLDSIPDRRCEKGRQGIFKTRHDLRRYCHEMRMFFLHHRSCRLSEQ